MTSPQQAEKMKKLEEANAAMIKRLQELGEDDHECGPYLSNGRCAWCGEEGK